jgi:hypothetical protein
MRFERCRDSCLRPMFRRQRLLELRAPRTRMLRKHGLGREKETERYQEDAEMPRRATSVRRMKAARRVYIHTMRSDTGFSTS